MAVPKERKTEEAVGVVRCVPNSGYLGVHHCVIYRLVLLLR